MTTTLSRRRAESTATTEHRRGRGAARAAAAILLGLTGFQVALALGAPLGRAAWGGTHTVLPTSLRVLTVLPIATYLLGGLVVLRRAGYRVPGISESVARRGTWLLAVVLGLGVLPNLASGSAWERLLMAPVALVLLVLTVVVALSSRQPHR